MADIGCFLKDTQVISEMEDIMQIVAAINISDGKTFTVSDAYNYFRENDIEVDLETIGAIYENKFDLSDGNFNSKSELDEIVGRNFDRTLNSLAAMQPKNINEVTGEMSAGKRVAQKMASIFRNANVTDNKTKSLMKVFQDAMESAALRLANKSALPKRVVEKKSLEEILSDAFTLNSAGVRTLSGDLNGAQQLFNEFQKEIGKYRASLLKSNANPLTIEQFDLFTDKMVSKGYDLFLSEKDNKQIVRDALIEGGAFREVTKDGVKQKVLDWKKLTNSVGDMNYLREEVSRILSDKGYTNDQIDIINSSLENEYVDLRARIIERQQKALDKANESAAARPVKELERRNSVRVNQQSVDAKRLAQLYTYGLFDATPNTYENILNSVFGMSELDQETFSKLKVFGHSLQTLYSAKLGDNELSEVMLKSALNSINEQIGSILRANSSNNSRALKVARTIQSVLDASLRFILTGLKNMAWQNPLSGKAAKITAQIQSSITKTSTNDLDKQNREIVKAVFKDMVLDGGLHYGDVNTTFVNRGRLDEIVNNMSSNQMYHAIVGTIIGRTGLDAMDSRFKASISEKYLVHNLVKILTSETNPNKMSKEDALNYVSEKLTGHSYKEAEDMAKQLIDKVNSEAALPILNSSPTFITRLANDIVKAQLMSGGIITSEQIESAYNAAYRASGRDLGHVPNNFLSLQVNSASNIIQKKIEDAVKRRNYSMAAAWTYGQIFMRNFANPFVGGMTNWIVLKFEKGGAGLVTGLLSKAVSSKETIDISTDAGMRDLESYLYEQMKADNKLYRGAVGAASSLVFYGVISLGLKMAFGGEDDEARKRLFNQWRKDNRWLSKYTDELTPEWMLAELAVRNNESANYLSNYLGYNDNYSAVKLIKDGVALMNKGDVSEGWGKIGEAVGTKVNLPIPGWRTIRDVIELGEGFFSQSEGQKRVDELKKTVKYKLMTATQKEQAEKKARYDYQKSISFVQGLMKRGFLETIGIKVNPEYTIDALPGISGKSVDRLKELGINNMEDLSKKRNNLKSLRYKDAKGRSMPIFSGQDEIKAKEILNKMVTNK